MRSFKGTPRNPLRLEPPNAEAVGPSDGNRERFINEVARDFGGLPAQHLLQAREDELLPDLLAAVQQEAGVGQQTRLGACRRSLRDKVPEVDLLLVALGHREGDLTPVAPWGARDRTEVLSDPGDAATGCLHTLREGVDVRALGSDRVDDDDPRGGGRHLFVQEALGLLDPPLVHGDVRIEG